MTLPKTDQRLVRSVMSEILIAIKIISTLDNSFVRVIDDLFVIKSLNFSYSIILDAMYSKQLYFMGSFIWETKLQNALYCLFFKLKTPSSNINNQPMVWHSHTCIVTWFPPKRLLCCHHWLTDTDKQLFPALHQLFANDLSESLSANSFPSSQK